MSTHTTTPEALREKAEAARQSARDSWERSDTDGFLSQWSSNLTARKLDMEADLLEAGGTDVFAALYDRHGRRLRARLVDGQWGPTWVVQTSTGGTVWVPDTVTWDEVPAAHGTRYENPRFGPRTKATKLGLRRGEEQAPARVEMVGSGTGLGSLHTVRPVVRRADTGYPANAVPWEVDG